MTTITYARKISCAVCGPLHAWTWTEGDRNIEINLQLWFETLKKHQDIKRGHWLRFKETSYVIQP